MKLLTFISSFVANNIPPLKNSELECWAFTSCKEELGIQMNTTQPSPTVSPTLAVVYVPGYGGAQVPVFGGVNYTLMQPTSSPAPTVSDQPSAVPSLPPAVAAREKMATYFCGELCTKLIFTFPLAFIY
jgi:hypothetical protein